MAMRPKRNSSAPLAPNGKSQYNNSVTSTTGEGKVSTPDFMKTGKKNPKLWENTLLNTVKNGGITKEKPSSVNLPDLGKRSTDSATGEDDFTAWIKDKNKTLSFVKDLPNREERAFGAAIFGKEAEERAYNRSVVEEMQKIGLAPNKTQDQLFREGFYGIEEEPDYTAILKNAIKTSQKETPIQFLERRNREVQNQKLRESQSYGGAKNNFGMESPYLGKKVEPKKQDEKSFLDTASEWLTYASFVPGLDTVTNVVQFPIDLARGDYVGAALDIVGAIPFYGEGADAIKTTRLVGDKIVDAAKAARKADKIVDTGKAVVKNGDEIIDTAHDVAQTAKAADKAHDAAMGVIRGADGRADSVVVQGKRIDVNYLENNKGRIAQNSPIEIPPNATAKVERKNGYLQVKYEWNDDTYKYKIRWHTRNPGAPTNQESCWRVDRRIPGKQYGKNLIQKVREVMIGENQWIPETDWKSILDAQTYGTITKQQKEVLKNGHFPDITQY